MPLLMEKQQLNEAVSPVVPFANPMVTTWLCHSGCKLTGRNTEVWFHSP